MGLDIAEIVMDIEDKFGVSMWVTEWPDEEVNFTVGFLIDLVSKNYGKEAMVAKRQMILDYEFKDSEDIVESEFTIIGFRTGLRVEGRIFRKNKWPTTLSELVVMFDEKMAKVNFNLNVEATVIEIIKKNLCLKEDISREDHLIRDLGAD